ncbi:MAG: AAA family ATPase [Planctomycetota bacterium]|nr:AAA family ATPase [Planctomycetota bacterium]
MGTKMRLIDKYRPTDLDGVIGQGPTVDALRSFLVSPHSAAFLFAGPTGTGKSSAALALAIELGVDVGQHEFGGLHRIPAGEQDADAVRTLARDMTLMPWSGSGWRVAIVDEADHVTKGAAQVWLSVLENLGLRRLVIFTTNDPAKLPGRFRDRCETFEFRGEPMLLGPAVQVRIDSIVGAEGILATPPRWQDLAEYQDGRMELSVRQVIQALDGWMRARSERGAA